MWSKLWQLMPHGLSMIGSITVKGQMIFMQNPEDTVNLPYDKYYLTKPYSTLPEGVQYNNFGSYHEILLTGRAEESIPPTVLLTFHSEL